MQLSLTNIIFFILASSIGATSRLFISNKTIFINSVFPINTLLVNLCGSFLIGLMWSVSQHYNLPGTIKLIFIVGFLGSFTTFSTFSLDCLKLIELNYYKHLTYYLITSIIGGVLLVIAGYQISKLFFR